jgi:hypothetical protein
MKIIRSLILIAAAAALTGCGSTLELGADVNGNQLNGFRIGISFPMPKPKAPEPQVVTPSSK